MSIREEAEAWVSTASPGALVADGLGRAIIGILKRPAGPDLVVYSCPKVVDLLIKDGMSEEEAQEYAEFNIYGAYVGPNTPLFVHMASTWHDDDQS